MAGTDDETGLPQGIELTAVDQYFRDNPYPVLKTLLERAPGYRQSYRDWAPVAG